MTPAVFGSDIWSDDCERCPAPENLLDLHSSSMSASIPTFGEGADR